MAYTKTTWTNGDLITASKLNKMEQGIADGASGGVMVITETYDPEAETSTLSATWQEIKDSMSSGVVPFVQYVEGDYVGLKQVETVNILDEQYILLLTGMEGGMQYEADTATDYPVLHYT